MASAWAVPPAASLGSLSQSALQLFCGSHRAGDQAQATLWAVRARPDPACSEQPCAPLSRPHHPTRDAHGLQCLQGSGCAGGWVPSPVCTSSTGIRDGGLGLPKPHTGPRTGVPCTHIWERLGPGVYLPCAWRGDWDPGQAKAQPQGSRQLCGGACQPPGQPASPVQV